MTNSNNKSFLLVTFPVDLGNRTYETNLKILLGDHCDFYRFAADQADQLESGINYRKNLRDRIIGATRLRNTVSEATRQGKQILFHGISPALFSFGTWKQNQTCIILDWTRSLYPRTSGIIPKRNLIWNAHQKVLKSCRRILCLTEAARECVILDYEIPRSRTCLVPAPFNLEALSMKPRETPSSPRCLFMGGDLTRKGGDLLIDAVRSGQLPRDILTMATNDLRANIPGIVFRPNIKFGSTEHRAIFESHDILILPTRMDSYPQVIGEAAAMGLAVITTRFALGAPHIIQNDVSGYITDSPESTIPTLIDLLKNPNKIDSMKNLIYQQMHHTFSKERILSTYLKDSWA